MARISDPDKLGRSDNPSTGAENGNVYFDLSAKTIELISTTTYSGNLVNTGISPAPANSLADAGYNDGGVDLQALYSFIKEQWKSQSDLIKYPFPMEAITAEQFEFINGWTLTDGTESPAQQDSKKLIRNAGYAERDENGTIQAEYAGIISLGTFALSTAQAYYAFVNDSAPTNFRYTGPVNEAIQIFENGGADDRNERLTLYVRPAPTGTTGNVTGYTFGEQNTTDIGVTVLATQAYRFPLSTAIDINIDKLVSELTGGVYDNMAIEYYDSPQEITETGTSFFVGAVIDANVTDSGSQLPTVKEIYNWVQNELRSTAAIQSSPGDSADSRGDLRDRLVEFVGSTLKTLAQDRGQSPANDGVFIEGISASDFNNVEFIDNAGSSQVFPFKVGVDLTFNDNIANDPNSKYFLFYTTLTDVVSSPDEVKEFGTANAVLVTKDGGGDVTGDIHTEATTVGAGVGEIDGLQSGTGNVDASANTLTNASGGYTDDELIGKILSVTAGANTGKYFITDNTATVITIDSAGKTFDTDVTGVAYEILNKNIAGGTTPKITFTYNYAANVDGGKASDIDAAVTLVALGLNDAQYAKATGNITRVNSVTLPLSNPLERNYEDPIGL
jgi:hypothetical protein